MDFNVFKNVVRSVNNHVTVTMRLEFVTTAVKVDGKETNVLKVCLQYSIGLYYRFVLAMVCELPFPLLLLSSR